MSEAQIQIIKGFVRHALQCAGGALATNGVIRSDQVETTVGIGLSVAAWAWSSYRKWKRAKDDAKKG